MSVKVKDKSFKIVLCDPNDPVCYPKCYFKGQHCPETDGTLDCLHVHHGYYVKSIVEILKKL